MDSLATLVNPTELPDRYAHTVLCFDRDSLTNADLRVRGERAVLYTIRTLGRSFSRTELSKNFEGSEAPVVVATIERNEILPDTIKFRGSPSMRMSKWLKHKTFTVSRPDSSPISYIWKPTGLREIALYDETNPLAPAAWFRTAHLRDVDGVEVVEMPTLSLQPEGEQIAELVLASLLVVEQKYRMQSQRVVQKPYPVSINGNVAS